MIRTFIQMTSLILTLGASFFLLKANLGLSPKIIAKLSHLHLDYHEETLKNLSEQSANTRVGFALLLASFILQLGNSLWPLRWKDFGIDWCGVLISIGCCVIILAVAYRYSSSLSRQFYEQSMQQIKTHTENKP
jgi:hypothetical protein